jgi:hypothetical protein
MTPLEGKKSGLTRKETGVFKIYAVIAAAIGAGLFVVAPRTLAKWSASCLQCSSYRFLLSQSISLVEEILQSEKCAEPILGSEACLRQASRGVCE